MTSWNAKTLTQTPPTPDCAPKKAGRAQLWVRTAAGPSIGFGHLRRALTLARMLADDAQPSFLLDPDDFWSRREAAHRGWTCLDFRPGKLWRRAVAPSLILIDTRKEQGLRDLITAARGRGIPVASIHDLGLSPVPSDVGIDGSVMPGFGDNGPAVSYTGPRYLVLDPAYSETHRSARVIRSQIQSVVVNLGGGDSSRYFLKVLKGLLLWDRELQVVGVRGFVSWGQDQLKPRDWQPLRFRWAGPDEPIPELLRQADIAITAGGLSAFESLCSGTPLMALAYDRLQHSTISYLAKAGVCVDLNGGELLEPQRLPYVLTALERDLGLRKKMAVLGRRVVDGRGAERVCRILRGMISRHRGWARPRVRSRGTIERGAQPMRARRSGECG